MRFSLLALWLVVLIGCGSSSGDNTTSSWTDQSSISQSSSATDGDRTLLSSLTFEDPVFTQCVMRSGVETVAELKILGCYHEVITYSTRQYETITQKISSIKGIEQLTSLEILELSYTDLFEADLSNNPALTEVSLLDSKIEKLNLNNLTHLKKLTIGLADIRELNVSSHTNLQSLMLYSLPLTQIELGALDQLTHLSLHDTLAPHIDMSGTPKVKALDIAHSPIESLNPEHLTSLEEFTIGAEDEIFKRMTELEDSGETIFLTSSEIAIDKLKSLVIYGGKFKSINISTAISLEKFTLNRSYVENLDLTATPNIKSLSIWGDYSNEKKSSITVNEECNLTDLSLSEFDINGFNLEHCKNLVSLGLYSGINIDSLNLQELDQLETLMLYDNNLNGLSLPIESSLKELSLIDDKLPLLNLENSHVLTTLDTRFPSSAEHQIILGSIGNIEVFEADGGMLTNISASNFTNTKLMRIYSTRLDTLDLSKSSKLQKLSISTGEDGELSDLQLPTSGNLKQLSIDATELEYLFVGNLIHLESVDLKLSTNSEIDLSQAPSITQLEIADFSNVYLPNKAPLKHISARNCKGISQLDLSSFPNLETLFISETDTVHVDLSNNNRMREIISYNTALQNIELPTLSETDELRVHIKGEKNIEISNIESVTDLYLQGGTESAIDLSNTYRLKRLSVSNAGKLIMPPNNGLEDLVLDNLKPDAINIGDYTALEKLILYNTGLQSVMINNVHLKEIGLSGLDLAHVSLGKLPQLEELDINNSSILEVDLSGVSNIKSLSLSEIPISLEQLIGLPLLKYLALNDFPRASLTLPHDSQLESFEVFGGSLETLTLGSQPILADIFIDSPKLRTIDFSGLPNLDTLILYDSLLQVLDLSSNNQLRNLTFYGDQIGTLNLSGLDNLESVQILGGSIPCENIHYNGLVPINCEPM